MIKLVCGVPRSGKGIFIMQEVVLPTLLNTNQTIVTNFALKLPELNEWLQTHYPEKRINLHERICFLKREEIKHFYLVRGAGGWRWPDGKEAHPMQWAGKVETAKGVWEYYSGPCPEPYGKRLKGVTKEEEKRDIFPDWNQFNNWEPCCYILDEARIHFDSRQYAEHGRTLPNYNQQHGKVGDSVWFSPHDPSHVDKLVRELCEGTISMRNMGKARYAWFRLPKYFKWGYWYKVPTKSEEPEHTGKITFRQLNGLENCYDTAVGVGLTGTSADKEEKIGGLPWWVLIPVGLVMIFCIIKLPAVVRWGGAKLFSGKKPAYHAVAPSSSNTFLSMVKPAEVASRPAAEKTETAVKPPAEKLYLTGLAQINGELRVYFSDGSMLTGHDPDLTFIAESGRYVIVAGRTIRVRKDAELPEQKEKVESVSEKLPVAFPVPNDASMPIKVAVIR